MNLRMLHPNAIMACPELVVAFAVLVETLMALGLNMLNATERLFEGTNIKCAQHNCKWCIG